MTENQNNFRPNTAPPETNVDFSKYMGGKPDEAPAKEAVIKPEKNTPVVYSPKFIIMIIIFLGLAGTLAWLLIRQKGPSEKLPEGYRLVTPKNDTPRLEKIPTP